MGDVEALQRVLTRLALTDDDKLQGILEKLLPLVLGKLEDAPQPVQQQVLSILSHVNTRLQALPNVELPIDALAQLFTSSKSPLVRNFALVYLERGAPRAAPEARLRLLPTLLAGVAVRPTGQQTSLLRLATAGVESLAKNTAPPTAEEAQAFASKYPFLESDADRKVFLDFALRYILYLPASVKGPSSALQASRQASQQEEVTDATAISPPGVQTAAPTSTAPPGLSQQDVVAIEGKPPFPDAATLQARKLGILNFTALAAISPAEVLPLYLAAASDPSEGIARRGDELLKKRCAVDAARPPVNMENIETVEPLFQLFHGSLDDDTIELAARRVPAGPTLRSRLLTLFSKSVVAANAAPWAMMTVTTCLFGTGATPKVQQQGMEFAVWMFKHAEPATLAPAAPAVVENCLSLLDSSPSAAGQDSVATFLRSFAYQAIGQLAQRLPAALQGRTDLAARCFSALATEPPGVRAAVAEATSSLVAAFEERAEGTDDEILQLLESSINQHQDAVRGAAVQWAVRLFPFDHVQARYLCILGTADTRMPLATAAEEGLIPSKVSSKQKAGAAGKASVQYPSLSAMLQYLCSRHPALRTTVEEGRRMALPAKAFISAVKFLEECRQAGEPVSEADAAAYFVFLENALVREAPGELHAVALHALLAASASYRSVFTSAYASRPGLFERLLGHVDSGARDAAGRLLGTLSSGMSSNQVAKLVENAANTVNFAAEGKRPRFEEADGCAGALGYITAQLVTGTPEVPQTVIQHGLDALRKLLESTAAEPALRATAAVALGCAGLPLGEPGSHVLPALPDAIALPPLMAALMQDRDPKVAKKAAQGLGFLAYGHRSSDVLDLIVTSLLEQRTTKVESVSFAVGEALCLAFGGVVATADDMLHRPFTSLSDLASQASGDGAAKTSQEMTGEGGGDGVVPMEEEQSHDSTTKEKSEILPARDSAEEEVQRRILAALLDECVVHSRPEVRSCGAIWMVSLLLFCGRTAAVHAVLPRAQDALSVLLGDESELTQEMASRGLAAAYELADDATRAMLVESLVGVLSGAAGRKRRAGDITADTKVFESGAIGTAPGGGSLTTYKEICSLANELGQPDLVYRFMQLANHQAAVNASRGAAFGFASVAKLAGDALAPHVATLVPRLYRSLYDPQPKVRDAMNHIWVALVDDPRATLSLHFDAVAKGLVTDMTGSQWRAREAAALAASDLIQGRRWEEIRPHFAALWTGAFRTMDDVKESVRQAGLTLVRSVRGLTLRLADKELTPASEGKEAIGAALPLLLQMGLPSRVPEVQALSVDTLSRIIKAAGPELVKPHLNVVVPALLESLSGLEDVRLNYVEQHAERLGLDSGKLESARVQAAQGGALGETLDTCARHLDGETFAALAPTLGGLIRRGVGLNTRAGAGRFVAQVARRLGDDSAAASPQLMRALQEACAAERSPAVRRAYASANALLAKHAAQSRVDKHVAAWIEKYSADDADESARAVSGLLLRALAREASDVFARYAAEVAPVAYMAQFDPEPTVAALWGEIWEESTTSVGAGLRLHAGAVLESVQAGLKSGQWGRKKAAAAAAAKACVSGGDAVGPYALQLMTALLAELPGRLWDGKETVLAAVGATAETCGAALRAADPALPGRVVVALLEAAGKKKNAYRKEALIQLKTVISVWGSEEDFLPLVSPPLLSLASEFSSAAPASSAGGTTTNGTANADAEKSSVLPIAEVMGCLGAAWEAAKIRNSPEGSDWVEEGAAAAAAVLAATAKPIDQAAAIEAIGKLAKRCAALATELPDVKSPLNPASPGCQKLLQAVARVGEDGRAAALREDSLKVLGVLLQQIWANLGADERSKWREALTEVAAREKVPSVKSAAAIAAASLQG